MKVRFQVQWLRRLVPTLVGFAGVVATYGTIHGPGLYGQATTTAEVDEFVPDDLGDGMYSEMEALLEVTFLKIDVLTLTVRVPEDAAAELRRLTEGREYSEELADSVAAVMLSTNEAWARQVFERDVDLGRLLGGMTETTRKAAEAGYVSQAYADEFEARAPEWFAFLRERGAKEGDELFFRIRGDEVRTSYRTVDGQILMNEVGESPEGRRASIPSFFAPGSRFRERLVESLLKGT